MSAPPPTYDAPPDPGLLADLVEAVEGAETPSQAALEEAAALLECRPLVARELRRRKARRLMRELVDGGASIRKAAAIAGRRWGFHAQTLRQRWEPPGH